MTGHHLIEGGQSIILIALLNILLCSSLTKRRSFKIGYPLKASIPLQRIRRIKSLNFVSLLVDVSHWSIKATTSRWNRNQSVWFATSCVIYGPLRVRQRKAQIPGNVRIEHLKVLVMGVAGVKSGGAGGRGGKRERVKRNLSPIPSSKFPSPRPPTRPYCFWHLRRRLGWWNAGGNCVNCSLGQTSPQSSFIISEFTQQDRRKKRTTKRLSVTNVTGLLIACFVGNSLNIDVFLLFYKKICLKECEVWRKVFWNKIFVTLVTQGLPSSFLPRPVA